MDFFRDLFKPAPTLQEKVKEMQTSLKNETRNIEKQIKKIELEEKKVKIEAKKVAKQNKIDCLKILAKEIVRTKKAIRRLQLTKSQISSVSMQINLQMSQLNMTKSFAKSTQIMKMMNSLCKVPQIANVMQNMSSEMIKMNLIEETMNDQIDDIFDDIEEGEVEEEVNKVIDELMMGVRGSILPSNELQTQDKEIIEEKNNQDDIDVKERLDKLRYVQ